MSTKLLSATSLPLLAATVVVQVPGSAEAYDLNNPRGGNSTTLYLDPNVQVTLPDHYAKLQNAASKLDANPSSMRFSLVNDNDFTVALNNGESEVALVAAAVNPCGSIACTFNWSAGGIIVESDVFFDLGHPWATTDAKADSVAYDPGDGRPILNTALHEFGHALGLGHEDQYFQVMGNAWNVVSTNGTSTESVISEDSSNGLIAHYGLRANVNQDLSLYHWEWAGASGAYSTHARTPIQDGSGAALAAAPKLDPSLNEPAYYVSSGQTIKVRQTAENRGTSQTVTIKWYLSSNSTLTTGDTLLATSSITKGRSVPFTWDRNVTLPGNLPLGSRWWVGAIIDSEGVLAEQNEINNAVYIAEVVVQ